MMEGMEDLIATLEAVDAALGDVVSGVLEANALSGESDDRLLAVVGLAARVARRAEALMIEGTAQIDERSRVGCEEKMTARYGCRSVSELLQRVARVSSRSAGEYLRAGHMMFQSIAASTGELLPAEFPALRRALASGVVGVDGVLAVTGPLSGLVGAAGRAAHLAADEELAAAASGAGVDGDPAACADDLKALAGARAMYFDQDGAVPRERVAMRKRGITIGVCRDGIVPIRGALLPEVAAQLRLIGDSITNPKVEGSPLAGNPWFTETPDVVADEGVSPARADERTRSQKLHDAFAILLGKIAGSGMLPNLGGTPPVLVVSARAEDVEAGRGFAHLEGCDEPVSIDVARQVACAGAVQRVVLDENGRIVSLGTIDRVFNAVQRRAIGLRDGGCVIPGCHVPASWCELHHVTEHAVGGPTHTDNGVMVCWWHHRSLATSGWGIRMNRGSPEVRGPRWWDPHMKWRPVTKSPARMRELVARRN